MSVTKDILDGPLPPDPADWRDALIDFLNEKTPDVGTCKACGVEEIGITPALVTVPRWDPKERRWTLNGVTYPLALLVCGSCGHVDLYSAALAGITKDDVAS